MLKQSKSKFYANLIDNSNNKSKTIWNLVNRESGKKNCKNVSLRMGNGLVSDCVRYLLFM